MNEVTRWVSFTDGVQNTWLFDVDFLLSDWKCTFGNGCPGTEPDDNGARGCCAHGAYLIDDDERTRIASMATRLLPDQWEHHDLVATDEDLFAESEGDTLTATADNACVFLNSPAFAGGHGCALHIGALAHGELPMSWKPSVCWQVPFRLEHYEDDAGTMTYALRRWRRSDWGEGGESFSWWCTDTLTAAPNSADQTWRHHRDEIAELIGPWAMEALVGYLEDLSMENPDESPVSLRRK